MIKFIKRHFKCKETLEALELENTKLRLEINNLKTNTMSFRKESNKDLEDSLWVNDSLRRQIQEHSKTVDYYRTELTNQREEFEKKIIDKEFEYAKKVSETSKLLDSAFDMMVKSMHVLDNTLDKP